MSFNWEKFKRFLISQDPGVLGFITAVVGGNSTYTLIKSLTNNVLVPAIIMTSSYLVGKKLNYQLNVNIFLVDFLNWVIVFSLLFLFVEYFLKYFVIGKEDISEQVYKDKYHQNYINQIINTEQALTYNIPENNTNKIKEEFSSFYYRP